VLSAAYSASSAAGMAWSRSASGRWRYTYRMRSPNRSRSAPMTSCAAWQLGHA
jgi:hypothetical protein